MPARSSFLARPFLISQNTAPPAKARSVIPSSGRTNSQAMAMVSDEKTTESRKANRPIPAPSMVPNSGSTSANTASGRNLRVIAASHASLQAPLFHFHFDFSEAFAAGLLI